MVDLRDQLINYENHENQVLGEYYGALLVVDGYGYVIRHLLNT